MYEKGLYRIGIFNHFIKFPETVQTIEFFNSQGNPGDTRGPLNSRTRDGLGRYTAFGLIQLITGLSFGRILSFILIDQLGNIIASISLLDFIMLCVTALVV